MELDDNETVIVLEHSLALVFDAIALAQKGRRANPTKEQERKLNKTIARLEVERADLEELIAAIENQPEDAPPPSPADVALVAELTGRVERQSRQNATAAGALEIATDVLDLAIKLTA